MMMASAGSLFAQANTDQDTRLLEQARQLAQQILIVDTHIDVPERLHEKMEDISVRTPGGDFDYVRAKAGGLKALFAAVFVPSGMDGSGKAKGYADSIIDLVRSFAVQ